MNTARVESPTAPLTTPGTAPLFLTAAPWCHLVEHLQRLSTLERPCLYIPNPGNAGDALIAAATWQLFDALALPVRIGRRQDIREGDVVLLGGGGNLVPLYSDMARILEACLTIGVRETVLLPHTVRGHEALLGRLDERFHLYCRDAPSVVHVRQAAPRARAYQAPDLALGLSPSALLARQPRGVAQRIKALLHWAWIHRLGRQLRWHAGSAALHPDAQGLLTVWRSDEEARTARGMVHHDLSTLYRSDFLDRLEVECVAGRFLSVIARAKEVRTDRLHVAIGAQLMGRRAILKDNVYGKNFAVVRAYPELAPHIELLEEPPPFGS